jgi:hypothetical protein
LSTDLVFNLEFIATPSPYANEIIAYDISIVDIATNSVVIRETYTTPIQTVTLPSAGDYQVYFRVTDDFGIDSFVGSFSININAAPIADFKINKVGTQYSEYEVINNSSDDKEITAIDVVASLNGEFKFAFENRAQTYPLSLSEAGLWSIKFIATDNENAVTEQIVSVNVENLAPIANFNVTQDPNDKYRFTFNSNSTDDGPIVKYILKTDDMTIEYFSESFSYIYDSTGNKAVEIIVIDDGGNQSSWTTTLNIVNEKPIAVIGLSTDPPNTKLLKINSESTDSDGQIVEYIFSATNYDTGAIVEGRYPEVGTIPNFTVELDYGYWNVSVSVVDNGGEVSDPFVQDFEIINLAPVASYFISQISNNEFELNATASFDPDGYIVNYDYRFTAPDSSVIELSSNEPLVRVSLPTPGNWVGELVVMDNTGQFSNPSSKSLFVQNIAPVANVNCVDNIDVLTCDMTGSFDQDGSIVEYNISYGSFNESNNTGVFNFNLAESIDSDLVAQVRDNNGLVGEIVISDFYVRGPIARELRIICGEYFDEYTPLSVTCSVDGDNRVKLSSSIQWSVNGNILSQSDELVFSPSENGTFLIDFKDIASNIQLSYELAIDYTESDVDPFSASDIDFNIPENFVSKDKSLIINIPPSVNAANINISFNNCDNIDKRDAEVEFSSECLVDGANFLSISGYDRSFKRLDRDYVIIAGSNRVELVGLNGGKYFIYSLDSNLIKEKFSSSILENIPNGKYLIVPVDARTKSEVVSLNNGISRTISIQKDNMIISNYKNIGDWKIYKGSVSSSTVYNNVVRADVERVELSPNIDGIVHLRSNIKNIQNRFFNLNIPSNDFSGGSHFIQILKDSVTNEIKVSIQNANNDSGGASLFVGDLEKEVSAEVIYLENNFNITSYIKNSFEGLSIGFLNAYANNSLPKISFDMNDTKFATNLFISRSFTNEGGVEESLTFPGLKYFSLPGKDAQAYTTPLGNDIMLNTPKAESGQNSVLLSYLVENFEGQDDIRIKNYIVFKSFFGPRSDKPIELNYLKDIEELKVNTNDLDSLTNIVLNIEAPKVNDYIYDQKVMFLSCFETPVLLNGARVGYETISCGKSKVFDTLVPYSMGNERLYGESNDVIESKVGGYHYVTHWLSEKLDNAFAENSSLRINDCSVLNGGRYLDHKGHQNGTECDLVLNEFRNEDGEDITYIKNSSEQVTKPRKLMFQNLNTANLLLEFFATFNISYTEQLGRYVATEPLQNEFLDGDLVRYELLRQSDTDITDFSSFKGMIESKCSRGRVVKGKNQKLISNNSRVNKTHNNHIHWEFLENEPNDNIVIPDEPLIDVDYRVTFNPVTTSSGDIQDSFDLEVLNTKTKIYFEEEGVFKVVEYGFPKSVQPDRITNIFVTSYNSDDFCNERELSLSDLTSDFDVFPKRNFRSPSVELRFNGMNEIEEFFSEVKSITVIPEFLSDLNDSYDFSYTNLEERDALISEYVINGEFPLIANAESRKVVSIYKDLNSREEPIVINFSWFIGDELLELGNGTKANFEAVRFDIKFKNGRSYSTTTGINFGDFTTENFIQVTGNVQPLTFRCLTGSDPIVENFPFRPLADEIRQFFPNTGLVNIRNFDASYLISPRQSYGLLTPYGSDIVCRGGQDRNTVGISESVLSGDSYTVCQRPAGEDNVLIPLDGNEVNNCLQL